MKRLHRIVRDERGMSYVFIGLGFMAFLSASMLAIDVGMLMTARNQAQNSADAAALSGAAALLYDDFYDRSPSGPAVTSAIDAAVANNVMGGNVTITPADVEFPLNPEGEPTRVRATVQRTVPTIIAQIPFFGRPTVDLGAVATAEVVPANAMTCVKPFTIPDKWREMQTPPWSADDTYDAFDNKGNPLKQCSTPGPGCADVYIPADQPGYTGYNQEEMRGERLVIRAPTGNNITVSFYFSIALGKPPVTGGNPYRDNIANCNTTVYHWGDRLTQEPGAMQGPTLQGAENLIARDPGAYWDTATKKVMGSAFGIKSPRVFPIPLYDPEIYDSGKRSGRTADLVTANWIGFFLEEVVGNGIWGRIIPIAGISDPTAGPAPAGLNPQAIRLVE